MFLFLELGWLATAGAAVPDAARSTRTVGPHGRRIPTAREPFSDQLERIGPQRGSAFFRRSTSDAALLTVSARTASAACFTCCQDPSAAADTFDFSRSFTPRLISPYATCFSRETGARADRFLGTGDGHHSVPRGQPQHPIVQTGSVLRSGSGSAHQIQDARRGRVRGELEVGIQHERLAELADRALALIEAGGRHPGDHMAARARLARSRVSDAALSASESAASKSAPSRRALAAASSRAARSSGLRGPEQLCPPGTRSRAPTTTKSGFSRWLVWARARTEVPLQAAIPLSVSSGRTT